MGHNQPWTSGAGSQAPSYKVLLRFLGLVAGAGKTQPRALVPGGWAPLWRDSTVWEGGRDGQVEWFMDQVKRQIWRGDGDEA